MKVLILLLIVFAIFFGCATLGYHAAKELNISRNENQPVDTAAVNGEQHRLIVVRVDRLDVAQPRLISVWYVSLFFLQDNPITLTLAQLFPSKTENPGSLALQRSFALNEQGEPASGFWDAMETFDLDLEGYVMVDTYGADQFLRWLIGPGDFQGMLEAAATNPDQSVQITQQTCQAVASAASRDLGTFRWSDLAPAHFRTNLRLETGLVYWDRVTRSGLPVRCEVVPAQ